MSAPTSCGNAAFDFGFALSSLPTQALCAVLLHLPLDNRMRCAEVCRSWRAMLAERSLWLHLDLGVTSHPCDGLLRAAARRALRNVRSLDVTGALHPFGKVTIEALCEVAAQNVGLQCVRMLGDDGGEVDMDLLRLLLHSAPRLAELHADVAANAEEALALVCGNAPFAPLRLGRLRITPQVLPLQLFPRRVRPFFSPHPLGAVPAAAVPAGAPPLTQLLRVALLAHATRCGGVCLSGGDFEHLRASVEAVVLAKHASLSWAGAGYGGAQLLTRVLLENPALTQLRAVSLRLEYDDARAYLPPQWQLPLQQAQQLWLWLKQHPEVQQQWQLWQRRQWQNSLQWMLGLPPQQQQWLHSRQQRQLSALVVGELCDALRTSRLTSLTLRSSIDNFHDNAAELFCTLATALAGHATLQHLSLCVPLRHLHAGPHPGVDTALASLITPPMLTSLDLSGCRFREEELVLLLAGLAGGTAPRLRGLDLSGEMFLTDAFLREELTPVALTAAKQYALTTLNLLRARWSPLERAVAAVAAVRGQRFVFCAEHAELCSVQRGDLDGEAPLQRALKNATGLTRCVLGGPFASAVAARSLLASDALGVLQALVAHPTLEALTLEGDLHHAAEVLGDVLGSIVGADAALESIRCAGCCLGDAGLSPLVEALARNTRLRRLECSGNNLTAAFTRKVLLPAVRENAGLELLSAADVLYVSEAAVAAAALVEARWRDVS